MLCETAGYDYLLVLMEEADHTEVYQLLSVIYLHSDTPYHPVPSQAWALQYTVLFDKASAPLRPIRFLLKYRIH